MKPNVYIDGELVDYHITKDGRVFSLNYNHTKQTKELKYCIKCGYLYTTIRGKPIHVARLIAQAYIPNPSNLPEVDHINRNKLDNRLENIRWVSKKENMLNRKYMERHGNPVYCFETGEWYRSVRYACDILNCDQSDAIKVLKGKKNNVKGYHFCYLQ